MRTRLLVPAAQHARAMQKFHPSKMEGAGNAGCSATPAASCARIESTRVSHRRQAEAIRHSLRDGVTAYSVLSPAIGY